MTAALDYGSLAVTLVRYLPAKWQGYAKAWAAALFGVLTAVLPVLVATVDLPVWVAAVSAPVLAVLGALAVTATPNVPGYTPRHGSGVPVPTTDTA